MTANDHPFSIPLSEFTTDELDKRYSDLMNRWNIARRMNMDQSIMHQLDLLLGSIELEKERRFAVDEKPDGVILDTDPIQINGSPHKRR
jgi:hypothetical protein